MFYSFFTRRSFLASTMSASLESILRVRHPACLPEVPERSRVFCQQDDRIRDSQTLPAQAGLNAVDDIRRREEHQVHYRVHGRRLCVHRLRTMMDGMDIFLLGGSRLEGAPPGASNRLYHNNRDGTFTDVTLRSGDCSIPGGAAASAWEITTMMVMKIYSALITDITSYIVTTETAHLRT